MPKEKMINHKGRHPKLASSSSQKGTPTAKSKSNSKASKKSAAKQY